MSLKKGTTTISGLGGEGYSPSASVSQSGDTTTISITDKNGTTTANIDLSNKQNIMQYSTMPTASASNEGKIVQYIGTTDSTYTNGYFYKCVENSGSYSWENIQVQTGGSGGDSYKQVYYLTTYFGSRLATSLNATDIATCNKIIDEWRSGKDILVIAKDICFWNSSTNNDICNYAFGIITSSGNNVYFTFYRPYVNGENMSVYSTCLTRYIAFNNVGTPANVTSASLSKANQPTIDYDIIRIGNTIPYTVSGDYNPAHKKYVDDKPTTYSGYDATKTQVLKNINGTLTWVDE